VRRGVDERGQFAGIEAIPFGLLVVVVGGLVVANAWGVVDAKFAVSSAARAATRAYVETPAGDDARARAQAAAGAAMAGFGRDADRLEVELVRGSLSRCEPVEIRVRYRVPAVTVPWLGSAGSAVEVTASHVERVDPYRTGLAAVEGGCGA